jgi:hypothetical protein
MTFNSGSFVGFEAVRTHVLLFGVADLLYCWEVLLGCVEMIYCDLVHSDIHYGAVRTVAVISDEVRSANGRRKSLFLRFFLLLENRRQ